VFAYALRRLAYSFLVVQGVLGLLFVLFFLYAQPADIARRAVGEKAPPEVIKRWVTEHGYDRPWPVQLRDHYWKMLTFDFGRSDRDGAPIVTRLRDGAGPSLSFTVPAFVLSLLFGIGLSLFVAYLRGTAVDRVGVVLAVLMMSLSVLLYIIGGQFLFGKVLSWFPISGFDPDPGMIGRFLAMPIAIYTLAGLGGEVRFNRTLFIEETSRDYVRTARAKGVSEWRVIMRHVFRNALIPITTVAALNFGALLGGAIVTERIFNIPGIGGYIYNSIRARDGASVVGAVTVLVIVYLFVNLLVDLLYGLLDPRISHD
jgi:peptide/nickel transport system permease protein